VSNTKGLVIDLTCKALKRWGSLFKSGSSSYNCIASELKRSATRENLL